MCSGPRPPSALDRGCRGGFPTVCNQFSFLTTALEEKLWILMRGDDFFVLSMAVAI